MAVVVLVGRPPPLPVLDDRASVLDDRLTDARTWQPGDRLYRVGENVSIYPASWHEKLADTTDVSDYVEVMLEGVRAPEDVAVEEYKLGVRQEDLVTAVEIIGKMDHQRARDLLRDQRVGRTSQSPSVESDER